MESAWLVETKRTNGRDWPWWRIFHHTFCVRGRHSEHPKRRALVYHRSLFDYQKVVTKLHHQICLFEICSCVVSASRPTGGILRPISPKGNKKYDRPSVMDRCKYSIWNTWSICTILCPSRPGQTSPKKLRLGKLKQTVQYEGLNFFCQSCGKIKESQTPCMCKNQIYPHPIAQIQWLFPQIPRSRQTQESYLLSQFPRWSISSKHPTLCLYQRKGMRVGK